MKRFAVAAICTVCLVGYAMSAEFTMTLKSIDNDTLVGTKKKKGAKKGDAPEDVKIKVDLKKVEVFKGMADPDKKGAFITEGKKEEAGLKSTLILSDNNKIPEKGVTIRVYTEGEGDKEVVTKILVLQKKAAP